MSEIDIRAQRASSMLGNTLRKLASLVGRLVVFAALVGVATYLTGLALTDNSIWPIAGIVVCGAPLLAAGLAWWKLRRAAALAPRALTDLHTMLRNPVPQTLLVLFDHDTQQPIGMTARDLTGVKRELTARRKELPALFQTVTAVGTVPGLAVGAIVGTLVLGLIGTVMLFALLLR